MQTSPQPVTAALFSAGKNPAFKALSDTNMAATPINISRVIEDDTIVKETIESTGGYRNNLLHIDQVVVALIHFNGKWGKKYCAVELEIDHLYILPVSAPQIYAAASTSSTNTQLRLQLSNSTRASRRSSSISRVTDASAACPFRPRLWSVI
jgi:hypothetical protein